MRINLLTLAITFLILAGTGCDKDNNSVKDCGQIGKWCIEKDPFYGCLMAFEFRSNGDLLIGGANSWNYEIEGNCDKFIITGKQGGEYGSAEWDIIWIEEDKMKIDILNSGIQNSYILNNDITGVWERIE